MKKTNQRSAPTLFKHLDTGHYYTISDGPLGKRLGYVKVAHPYGTGGETITLDGRNGRSFDRFVAVGTLNHGIVNNRCLTASHAR
jgi:hypothetical protein